MKHLLAAVVSLHDGSGIFALVWSIVVIPIALAMMLNYRGMAKRPGRPGSRPTPLIARIVGGLFFAFGLLALFEAIHRFAQGGY